MPYDDLQSPSVYGPHLTFGFNMAAVGSSSDGERRRITRTRANSAPGDPSSAVEGHENGHDGSASSRKPFLIGVAGGTASGKSTVCNKIIEALKQNGSGYGRQHVEVISQESFYRLLTSDEIMLASKGQFDFDHPDAFDEALMTQTLKAMLDKKPVDVPMYDFRQHKRTGWKRIEPADVILFEGILVFYYKPLVNLFNVKLFVDTDADTRLARRVERDMKGKNRQLDQILHQYITYVKPAFEEFCLPTKKYADIIIPRGADNTVAIDLIVQHIQDLLQHGRTSEPAVVRSISVHSTESTTAFRSHDEYKYGSAH